MMFSMISTGPGNCEGTGPGIDAESEGKPESGVVRSGVGKIGTKLGGCAMDVIVVTAPRPQVTHIQMAASLEEPDNSLSM